MITIHNIENTRILPNEDRISVELRGLSTDEKPTIVANKNVDNGSVFIEMDTGTLYFFDFENQEWKEV